MRELENEIRRAVALVEEGKEISADLFSERIGLPEQLRTGEGSYFKSRVASLERRMIVEALRPVRRQHFPCRAPTGAESKRPAKDDEPVRLEITYEFEESIYAYIVYSYGRDTVDSVV